VTLPRVWLLVGTRQGDNNQLLALGEALGVPFETRTMFYKWTARLWLKLFPAKLGHLSAASRRWLQPPWPDVVIGIGRRTVAIARWIQQQSGGRTSLIRLGHPHADNDLFDLVITTRQYPVPPGDNVAILPLAMNRFWKPPAATQAEQAWLDARPRPHLLLSLGGTAPMWRLDMAALRLGLRKLVDRAQNKKGTLIVVGSRRTSKEAWAIVREMTAGTGNAAWVERGEVRYPVLLNDADEQFVTADSVSMISEAVMSGKPVGLIPVEPDALGRRLLGNRDPETTKVRDPRRFWKDLRAQGLAGTVDEPLRGKVREPVEIAVAAVRKAMPKLFR
jgi:mitochondrial fission protein ELM1